MENKYFKVYIYSIRNSVLIFEKINFEIKKMYVYYPSKKRLVGFQKKKKNYRLLIISHITLINLKTFTFNIIM